jgi:hypothetical protein
LEHSYTSRHFGIREGLPKLQTMALFQDANGYLWVSGEGVSRFDGINFLNYSMKELQISTYVMKFYQYESAVVLVSLTGIVFIYPDQHIECYPFPDQYRLNHNVTEITENSIYLFNCRHESAKSKHPYTLLKFNLKEKNYTIVAEDLPFLSSYNSDGKLYAAGTLSDGKISAASDNSILEKQLKLYRLDDETLKMVCTVEMDKEVSTIDYVTQTEKNEWYGTITKEHQGEKTHRFVRFFIENDSIFWRYLGQVPFPVTNIAQWDKDHLLLGFKDNTVAQIVDLETHKLTPFLLNISGVNHIFVDRDNNFWFATETGLVQCPRLLLESYQLKTENQILICGVLKDSHDYVWFSTSNGFWRADKQGGLYKIKFTSNHNIFSMCGGSFGLCEDSRGRVFLPSDLGVAVYDPKKRDPDLLEMMPVGQSWYAYYDAENENVYFEGWKDLTTTLNILHKNGDLTTHFFSFRFISTICRDANRKLQLGTFHGTYFFDEERYTFVPDTVSRPYKSVICMTSDKQGTLWKGGWDGLFAEERNGNNQQISDKKTVFVVNYYNRYLIYGGNDKLHILDLQSYYLDGSVKTRTLCYYDGFDVIECNTNCVSVDYEGYVWVAGGDKVIRFLPDEIMKTALLQPQTPFLAAIYYADKNSEWTLLPEVTIPKLENKENHLRFDLLLASLSAPDKLVFRYKLEGYNNQWVTSKERSIIFQNLPFGKYRLEVQSSVDGEVWSESVFSPFITIKNPFLLTFLGLLLIFLGIAGVTLLIIFFTRKISIRKEEEKRRIENLKHRAVRAKFVPHFTGNVLNTINYFISRNPGSAQKYISDFADFMRHTLLNSEILYRTILEELKYTELYLKLEKLSYEERLEYEISVDSSVDLQQPIPAMALQTFCENALKHGLRSKPEGGKITIHVYNHENYIVLSVEDNGVGRKRAKTIKTEGTKEGLKIVQQQLDIFNKEKVQKAYLQIVDLQEVDGQPLGTRFELWV